MAEGSDSIVVPVMRLAPYGLIVIRSIVVPDFALRLVVNTGSPVSIISTDTYTELRRYGYIEQGDNRLYRIPEWNIEGRRMAPLDVRVSALMRRLGISGFLGLQFLGQFAAILFERDANLLTLTYPSPGR